MKDVCCILQKTGEETYELVASGFQTTDDARKHALNGLALGGTYQIAWFRGPKFELLEQSYRSIRDLTEGNDD